MNIQSSNQKEAGIYYTPTRLADYIVYRLFGEAKSDYKFASTALEVLEPSVGGGIFLDSLLNGNYYADQHPFKIPELRIDAIEIDPKVAHDTKRKSELYENANGSVEVKDKDYLEYFLGSNKKYDLIIGNPPYVRRRNMKPEQRKLCAKVHKAVGLRDENPKNLWTSFLAGAKASLKKKGVIAFVLPTDLLQVKYSAEIRELLCKDFERIEIFTFNWLTFKKFDDIEQDVVIIICSNGHGSGKDDVDFFHINNEEELDEPKVTPDSNNTRRTTLNKWTNYLLNEQEFKLIDDIHKKIAPDKVRYYCNSGAGIVTAANDYYIVDQGTVEKYSLWDIARPTIKKSSSMFSAVQLTMADLRKKAREGAELFLLDFPDKSKKELPSNYKEYLKLGEKQDINKRYKMLLRENWYAVPSVWSSEAFFTKRSNVYPRVIVNKADAYVTDAFYRIRVKEGFDVKNLSFSFYNTFTFIYAELMGRYYGGGVLELTPNEFKDLPLPYVPGDLKKELKRLDYMTRKNEKLIPILDYTDNIILKKHFGLSDNEVQRLRKIYIKLLRRRLKKNKLDIVGKINR